jgi:hypothetical protein
MNIQQNQDFMQNGIELPDRIFFTGVPGSRWSGIAQTIESFNGFNTTDRRPEREFTHSGFTGHKGAYFGAGMEFESYLDPTYINRAWSDPAGCKLVKSHDWANKLQSIRDVYPTDWIMLVYRPDMASYAWWHEAGGFNIKYPSYTAYKDSATMLGEIAKQNNNILQFASKHDLTWSYFTPKWIEQNFGQTMEVNKRWPDILVTLLK